LPARLAFYGGQIMPKAYFERVGPDGFRQQPVGTGPFRFSAWSKDDQLVLERFDGYWGGPPTFERVRFRPRPENAPRIAALMAGDADLVTSVPADQIDAINRSGRARVDGALFNGLHVLAVNSKVPPLDNPLVKQALSLAIDRDAIIRTVHRGQGVVPNGLIAQGDFGFDATLPPLEYNPDRAKQRLQASGYRGEPIVLETTQGYLVGDRQMAEIVDEMWRKVGINSKLELIEIAARAEKTREKTFKGLWWSDPASTVLDPDGMMYRLLGPGGSQDYWHHQEWEKLGEEARYSLDQELRLRSYRRMNEITLEHLPWIPVVQPRRLYGISNAVDFRPYGNGYLNLRRENLRPR
jgi:peptide/nickel transport system substrate-binding protein